MTEPGPTTEPVPTGIPSRTVRANAWPAWGGAGVLGFGGLMLWLVAAPRLGPTLGLVVLATALGGAVCCAGSARTTLTLDDQGVALNGLGERRRGWDEALAWEARAQGDERWAALVLRDGSRFTLPARFFNGDQAAHLRFGLVRRLGAPVVDEWLLATTDGEPRDGE